MHVLRTTWTYGLCRKKRQAQGKSVAFEDEQQRNVSFGPNPKANNHWIVKDGPKASRKNEAQPGGTTAQVNTAKPVVGILKRPTEVNEDTKQAMLNAGLVTYSGSTATPSANSDTNPQNLHAQVVEKGTVDPVELFDDNNGKSPLPIDDTQSSPLHKVDFEDKDSKDTTNPHELPIQGEVSSQHKSPIKKTINPRKSNIGRSQRSINSNLQTRLERISAKLFRKCLGKMTWISVQDTNQKVAIICPKLPGNGSITNAGFHLWIGVQELRISRHNQTPSVDMSWLIWNIRGIHQWDSKSHLNEMIRKHQIQILVLLQPKVQHSEICHFVFSMGFPHWLHGGDTNTHNWIFWKDMTRVTMMDISPQSITIRMNLQDNQHLLVTFVYASCLKRIRTDL